MSGDNHAADMYAEMSRESFDLHAQFSEEAHAMIPDIQLRFADTFIEFIEPRPASDQFGEAVHIAQ